MKTTITVFAALILAGCGGSSVTTQSAAGSDDVKRYEAEFTPSDHDPDPDAHTKRTSSPTPSRDDRRSDDSSTPTDDELIQGFRVQIFSATSIDAAKAKRADAESYFPGESVYMQYDPPTYKIRIGNFTEKYEADRFVRLAIEKGFPESWTVPEKVYKNPSPPQR